MTVIAILFSLLPEDHRLWRRFDTPVRMEGGEQEKVPSDVERSLLRSTNSRILA